MKKILTLLCSFIFAINSFAQIEFEKGYIVDTLNVKTDCLIKNVDWRSTPSAFEYKLTEDSEIKLGTA